MKSHRDYLNRALEVYKDPNSSWSSGIGKYKGEYHIRNGNDLLRLNSDGSFKSLYDLSVPSRLK